VREVVPPLAPPQIGEGLLPEVQVGVGICFINQFRELKNYKWKEDAAGNTINQPVDKFNHGIDAVKYACVDRQLAERRVVRIRRV
jgi:hypothetical protein